METRQEYQRRIQDARQNIHQQTQTNISTLRYLRSINIYDSNIQCEYDECVNFEGPCYTIIDVNSKDGYRMQCQYCKSTYSIRLNSPFYKSKTPASTLIRLLLKETFSKKKNTELAQEYGLNRNTISKILDYGKNAVSYKEKKRRENYIMGLQPFEELDEEILEYASSAIEVDECLLTHMEQDQCWVVGLYERSSQEQINIVVGNNRTMPVINQIFTNHVVTDNMQRTRVYCDMFRGYNGLQELNYEVFRVNHSVEFGQGHRTTNHVESNWRVLREECRLDEGYRVTNIEDAQKEVDFAWAHIRLKRMQQNKVEYLIECIVEYFQKGYDLNNYKDFVEEELDEEIGDMEIEE